MEVLSKTKRETTLHFLLAFSRSVAFSFAIILFVSLFILTAFLYLYHPQTPTKQDLPLVINTWDMRGAHLRAWDTLVTRRSSVDAVEQGCNHCEDFPEECGYSVGYGGNPNEQGETTLDAMIMYGPTHDAGAVGCLKRVKRAISVARRVMEDTLHTILVGDDATNFAVYMNFTTQSLTTPRSNETWQEWKKTHVPNYWTIPRWNRTEPNEILGHDTIGMIAVDANGNICVGTSTNGLGFKIPGRVGDSPIPGAGAYVDNDVGGAVATGNGDVMMRFSPTFQAVEAMRLGMSPSEAAQVAVRPISRFYGNTGGAVIAVNKIGEFGVATYGTFTQRLFHYWVRTGSMQESELRAYQP